MIIVVEGPSAAGKSSWVAAHGTNNVIAENGRIEVPDDLAGDRLASFWSEANCRRWADAVGAEAEHGLALCDTDPLKLHYAYGLARVGATPWEDFDLGISKATDAIKQQRLGLADIVLVSLPDDETLARQRDSDLSRRRRNFDLHLQLGPSLGDWYSTLDRLDPGRVRWEFPTTVPEPVARKRYDVELFEAWMNLLPRGSGSS